MNKVAYNKHQFQTHRAALEQFIVFIQPQSPIFMSHG